MTEMIAEEQAPDLELEREVPQWLRSDVLDGEAREQAMDMMRRLTVHLKHKTTDMADSTMEEPIDNYLDPEVFRSEVDLIAVDPGPAPALVVVEVRWRSRRDYGLAEETLDWRKRAALRRAVGGLLGCGALPDGRRLPCRPPRRKKPPRPFTNAACRRFATGRTRPPGAN